MGQLDGILSKLFQDATFCAYLSKEVIFNEALFPNENLGMPQI